MSNSFPVSRDLAGKEAHKVSTKPSHSLKTILAFLLYSAKDRVLNIVTDDYF